VQHTAQLLLRPVRLGRRAAEHRRLALRAADLGDEGLEGAHPVAAHRPHVAGVDAERDHVLFRRRSERRRRHQRRALEPGADPQGPLPRGLDRGRVAEREELLQRPSVAAVWPVGGRSAAPISCTCRVPSAPASSSVIRHRTASPAQIPRPGT
jgi:hypothetical protein